MRSYTQIRLKRRGREEELWVSHLTLLVLLIRTHTSASSVVKITQKLGMDHHKTDLKIHHQEGRIQLRVERDSLVTRNVLSS